LTSTCQIDSLTTFNPLRDSPESPLGTGYRQQYGVQLSGALSSFKYFLSGDYEQETGFLEMSKAEQSRVAAERGAGSIPDNQVRPNAVRRIAFRANGGAPIGAKGELNLNLGVISNASRIPTEDVFT